MKYVKRMAVFAYYVFCAFCLGFTIFLATPGLY